MAAKIEDALQRELSCPICFELYSSPLLLPCGHTFCKDCLADTLEKHKQEGTANDDKGATAGTVVVDRSKLPCPTCRGEVDLQRQGLDYLRRNFLLDSIIEKYKAACARDGKEVKHKEEIILCDVCEKDPCKAVKSCTVCKISYCKKCLPVLHPSRGGLATHRMVRATSSSTPGVITCPSHEGELLKMYCTSCRTPVCYLCDRFGGHQGHQVSELKTVFGQEKDFLENEAKKLSGKNDGLQDFVKKIIGIINKIEEGGKEMEKRIKKEFSELHKFVDQADQRAHLELALNVAMKKRHLEEQMRKCQNILDDNTGTVEIVQQALTVDEYEPFLLSVANLRKRLTKSHSSHDNCSQTPVKNEGSDPLNLDITALKTSLSSLSLGYLPKYSFNWKSGSAHPNLKIDQETWKLVTLTSAVPTNITNPGTTSGAFQGPSFAVLGSNAINGSSGIRMWKMMISKERKTKDLDINYKIAMMTTIYRDKEIDANQSGSQSLCMVQGKIGKLYQYKFFNAGNLVGTTELSQDITSVVIVLELSQNGNISILNGISLKPLHTFTGCNMYNFGWYPSVALYNMGYTLELV